MYSSMPCPSGFHSCSHGISAIRSARGQQPGNSRTLLKTKLLATIEMPDQSLISHLQNRKNTPMHLRIESPLDMHLHLREGQMLALVAPLSAGPFAGGVIMPNLVPPVDTLERLEQYRTAVAAATVDRGFAPYMTLFFRPYTEAELAAARPG